MATINQSYIHSNPSLDNQMAFLRQEASDKLAAIRLEMSIRNFKSAQQFIHEHSELVSQMKQLNEASAC